MLKNIEDVLLDNGYAESTIKRTFTIAKNRVKNPIKEMLEESKTKKLSAEKFNKMVDGAVESGVLEWSEGYNLKEDFKYNQNKLGIRL